MAGVLTEIETLGDLARVLRDLRRREARERCLPELTYRELSAKTGWSLGVIAGYFSGKILPPTDRFDALIRLLGATPAEQGALATARDRVAERRPRKPRPSVPRQLPADVYGFAGRAGPLAELDSRLAEPAVAIAVLSGTAGVGKTALAVHWAHRVADRFPDGQLYVNLRGFDPGGAPVNPAAAVRGFLTSLGVPTAQVPADLDEQTALYRSLLATKRVLVLLDNARDAAQVRPLLPGSPGSVVVTTSRNRLTGLVAADGARSVSLPLLSTMEARDMLARRLGEARVAAEPQAAERIIEQCSRLPLALAIAAARAATDHDLPLARLAGELDEAGRRLDVLEVGDAVSDVRAVFSWSYRMLPAGAARLFRLLGLHPGPDIGVAAAASLADVPAGQARALLVELDRAHLLTEHAPGRFTFHDLLRAYAGELVQTGEGDVERRAAVHRILDHYLGTAHTAGPLLDPLRERTEPPPPVAGAAPEAIADRPAALAWFTAEHPVLLGAVTLAAESGFDAHACHLAWALGGYFHLRVHPRDAANSLGTALAAARRLSDDAWQARIHRDLLGATTWLGRYDESLVHARLALERYAELGDDVGRARCHRGLCLTYERQGRYQEALDHGRRSRDLLLGTDDRAGLAYAFNSVGWYHALVGDFQEALTNCRQAITLLQESGDRIGEATTWDSLGYAHHHLGEHRQALACYERALALFREFDDRYYEADTLDHVGDTYHAVGDRQAACDAWRRALTIFDELRRTEADAVRAKLTGG